MSALTDNIEPYAVNFENLTPSKSFCTPSKQDDHGNCVVCGEKGLSTELVAANCQHLFCQGCVIQRFELAVEAQDMFPPRCCRGGTIALALAQPFLRPELVERFRRKEIEHSPRTYCHDSNCQALIPSSNIDAGIATCPDCRETTCASCNSKSHNGGCPEDPGLEPLLETTAREGWKRCYNCHEGIEKIDGCNHMTYVSHTLLHFTPY